LAHAQNLLEVGGQPGQPSHEAPEVVRHSRRDKNSQTIAA
jgi:hypothetical protein